MYRSRFYLDTTRDVETTQQSTSARRLAPNAVPISVGAPSPNPRLSLMIALGLGATLVLLKFSRKA